MWKGGNEPPATDMPEVIQTAGGVKLSCKTKGASIGYQIVKEGAAGQPPKHTIQTWDYGFVSNRVTNGNTVPAPPSWSLYNGEMIPLQKGDVLKVNAMRIGYKPAEISYSDGKILKQSLVITDN